MASCTAVTDVPNGEDRGPPDENVDHVDKRWQLREWPCSSSQPTAGEGHCPSNPGIFEQR